MAASNFDHRDLTDKTQHERLVADCLTGSRRAQEAFYRQFAPVALTVCRRYGKNRAQTMEYLNIGMLKVFDKLEQFRWEGSLEGWIKRLVFHATIDELRKNQQRPTLEIADWDQATDAEATQSLFADDLLRIIDYLPEPSKEVFYLFAIEGYSHAEIAARLQFSEGNSRWHLNKARQLLKKKLNQAPFKINRYAG